MTHIDGQCHCGAVRVTFETNVNLNDIEVRACQCGFCRRHGARTISDHGGHMLIAAMPGAIKRYSFGDHVAEFLICRECGVYVAAVMGEDAAGGMRGTLNVNVLDSRVLRLKASAPVSYDSQGPEEKVERRLMRWMPTEIGAA